MGQLIVSEMVSLDGVMQAPGGPEEDTEGGFKHGGWQAPLLDEESFSLITRDIGWMDACSWVARPTTSSPRTGPKPRPARSRTNSTTHPSMWPPAAAASSNGTIPLSSRETFPRRWPASSKNTAKST